MDTCPRGHQKTGDNLFVDYKGHRRCHTCLKDKEARGRRKPPIDGLEEEYGPVPPKDRGLVDWVVLWRAAKEGKTSRQLTWAEGKLAAELGIYRNASRLITPAWTFVHYGDNMNSLRNETLGYGGPDVGDIENRLLPFMRANV